MSWFSDDSEQAQAYDEVQNAPHEVKLSHELIAAAASYEAAKSYNEHCEREGQPQSHEKAKEIFAGFAGAFADRMIETKGMDWIDREKVQWDAYEQHGADYVSQSY